MDEDVDIGERGRSRCGVREYGWKGRHVLFVKHCKRALGGDTLRKENARRFPKDEQCLFLPESDEVGKSERGCWG